MVAFGDYIEVYIGTDNTSKAHSRGYNAQYLTENSTGAWIFLYIAKKSYISRTNVMKMVKMELVCKEMNNLAAVEKRMCLPVEGAGSGTASTIS